MQYACDMMRHMWAVRQLFLEMEKEGGREGAGGGAVGNKKHFVREVAVSEIILCARCGTFTGAVNSKAVRALCG